MRALEENVSLSADTLLRRRNKRPLIIDIDSTEDRVHGKLEGAAFNRRFDQVCALFRFERSMKGGISCLKITKKSFRMFSLLPLS